MLNTICETLNCTKLTRVCLRMIGIGVILIKNFVKFWVGLGLLCLSVVSLVEFVIGTSLVNVMNSWTRLTNGQIHVMSFVENLSLLVLGIGFTLIITGIGIRVFWGFWRFK